MIEKLEHRGCTIEVHQDDDAENPREEWDNLTTMICFHRRYGLGDAKAYRDSDFEGWACLEAQLVKDYKPVFIEPLYMYDHGGLSLRLGTGFSDIDSNGWDWGQVGFVLVPRARALQEYSTKRILARHRELIRNVAVHEVEIYNDYLNGECYGYVAKAPDDTEINSCWGFLGRDQTYMLDEAKSHIDYYLDKETSDAKSCEQ